MTEDTNRRLVIIQSSEGDIYRGVSAAWPEAFYNPRTRTWQDIEVRFRPQGWGVVLSDDEAEAALM